MSKGTLRLTTTEQMKSDFGDCAASPPARSEPLKEAEKMNIYTDQELKNPALDRLVYEEHQRQIAKWGVQSRTAFEWMTYLTEEVGELAEAVSEHEYRGGASEAVTKEAVQVATLALKITEMFHSRKGAT